MRALVVADDFTGGNGVAGLLASTGMCCVNVFARRAMDTGRLLDGRLDGLIVTTETRHLPHAEARNVVATVVRERLPADLVANRIDTTLRGNVSATTMGVLEAVRGVEDRRTVALCVPAHPAAGRHTIGGLQLLEGVRLEETEVARDPLFPINSSAVADALTRTTDLAVVSIGLDQVTGPVAVLTDTLVRYAATTDAIVLDAYTDDHLRRIAAAAAATDEVRWVAVDPGPFTRHLAVTLGQDRVRRHPILAVVGSTSDLSRRQLRHLVETMPASVIDGRNLIADSRESERGVVRRVIEALVQEHGPDTVVLATAAEVAQVPGGRPAAFAERLGQMVRTILESSTTGGLYLTGGDVASAVLTNLDATGIGLDGEVIPLAAFGSIIGGPWEGTNVVTKGGLVGDTDTALRCVAQLVDAAAGARVIRHSNFLRSD